MDAIDIIKQLCKDKGTTVTQLESDLGYSNGSIGKTKNMSADRIYQISQYFGVSMEYLMTGKTIPLPARPHPAWLRDFLFFVGIFVCTIFLLVLSL